MVMLLLLSSTIEYLLIVCNLASATTVVGVWPAYSSTAIAGIMFSMSVSNPDTRLL